MFNVQENGVDAGRYISNLKAIEFGPWHISYDVSCILPSVCSTKVVCEREDDQFCQFCIYCRELKIPHFPDMVFPKNILRLIHVSGASISFNPLDALKCVASNAEAIEVSCAEAWQEARPDAEKPKRPFDWTFSTDYKGTLSDNIAVEATDQTINFDLLKKKDQILFYHDLTLFEDELHDHGVSKLSVKIRVMPSYWYLLLRYFLRVDDVLVRANETRMFHMLGTDYVLREYTVKEAEAKNLSALVRSVSTCCNCKQYVITHGSLPAPATARAAGSAATTSGSHVMETYELCRRNLVLFAVAPQTVRFDIAPFHLACLHGGIAPTSIYDARVDNLLKMQQGIAWPAHLRVSKGHEALMKLSSSLANMQKCEVVTPAGVNFDVRNPPNVRYELWSDGCGIRVKNVEASDHGRWRMTATRDNDSLTGWTELNVTEDTSSYTPDDHISLQDGMTHTEVQLTTLQNSYCLVTQPFSESSLVPGHCQVTLDRTTRAVQGPWKVVLGIPGRVDELEVKRNVIVETEQLVSGYKEDSNKLHLYCNILHTKKNITFCRFQKNAEATGFNVMDGLSNGHHSYYGDGFMKRQCGITIENPSIDDYITWRCTVGLQERNGAQITQSTPMQALIRISATTNPGINTYMERTNDVRTIFVEKESSFTITCRAEYSLAYCWFQHPNGTQFTPVERQSENERDFWYTGESLQTGDCGITFVHASERDDGKWSCHMGPKNILGLEITDNIIVRVTGPLAANKKEIGITVGSEVILYCHTANGPRPLDYCRFLMPTFVGISVDSSITSENAILGRFYFTPGRSINYGDCSLTINPVLEEDIGVWTCAALLHDQIEESSDKIVIYASKPRERLSNASIIGMSFGIFILGLILAGVLWLKKSKLIPERFVIYNRATDHISIELRNESQSTSRTSNGSGCSISEPQIPAHQNR